ncbi:MAG: hypothetical protein ACFFDH_18390 [Promethearchaeota archaeon]
MIEKEKTEIKTSEPESVEYILFQKKLLEIYDRGAKERYRCRKSITIKDTQLRFYLLKDKISDLKDLLYKDINPKDEKEIIRINELYTKADEGLNIKISKRKEDAFYKEIGHDKIPIVKFTSDDAGSVECFCDKEKSDIIIKETRNSFIEQQYNSHLSELEIILSTLEKELINRGIIKIEKRTLDDILDQRIDILYEKEKRNLK